MKKKSKYLVILIIAFVIIGIISFYLKIGIGFGNAVTNTVKGIDDIKKEWQSEGVNPLDSVLNSAIEIIDSTANIGH